MYQNAVALYLDRNIMYTDDWPCHPDKNYPELKKIFTAEFPLNPVNKVYSAVREIFNVLGMDSKNFGSGKWNPLSEIIEPGQTVLIKPNLVMHEMGLGLTVMYGRGGYTGDAREILFVIVERLDLADLKDIILREDPSAFMAVENLHEVVYGRQAKVSTKKRPRKRVMNA